MEELRAVQTLTKEQRAKKLEGYKRPADYNAGYLAALGDFVRNQGRYREFALMKMILDYSEEDTAADSPHWRLVDDQAIRSYLHYAQVVHGIDKTDTIEQAMAKVLNSLKKQSH